MALEPGLSERVPFRTAPMLATLVAQPVDRPGWVYEEKYDGFRVLGYKEGAQVTLLSRNAKDRTTSFPAVTAAVARLPTRSACLDGEVVAFDRHEVSRFQLLQQGSADLRFAVFDCLWVDGRDLRAEPLTARRAALERLVPRPGTLIPSRRLAAKGLDAYAIARRRALEGLVAKDATAPYVPGRSTRWLKVKVHQEEEFVIGGYTPPAGSRPHFGALLLGAYAGKTLHYVGKVGTGFTLKSLATLHAVFRRLARSTPPFVDPPRERGAVWLAPRLVAQVAFHEWTADRKLRQPVFLGLRDDKRPTECQLP